MLFLTCVRSIQVAERFAWSVATWATSKHEIVAPATKLHPIKENIRERPGTIFHGRRTHILICWIRRIPTFLARRVFEEFHFQTDFLPVVSLHIHTYMFSFATCQSSLNLGPLGCLGEIVREDCESCWWWNWSISCCVGSLCTCLG